MFELLEELQKRTLLLDGGMGTELIRRLGIKSRTPFSAASINLSNPAVVKQIHLDYLEAGADIMTTNTFTANEMMQSYYGKEAELVEQNKKGVQLAREAVIEYEKQTGKRAFVGANIGPLPFAEKNLHDKTLADVADIYRRQVDALLSEKPDLLIVECAYHLPTVEALATLIQQAFAKMGTRIPVMFTVPIYENPTMVEGMAIETFFEKVDALLQPEMIGFTCGEGLDKMEQALEKLPNKPLVLVPNAGLPDACGCYTMDMQALIDRVIAIQKRFSVKVVGGCCGTTPRYIADLHRALEEVEK